MEFLNSNIFIRIFIFETAFKRLDSLEDLLDLHLQASRSDLLFFYDEHQTIDWVEKAFITAYSW